MNVQLILVLLILFTAGLVIGFGIGGYMVQKNWEAYALTCNEQSPIDTPFFNLTNSPSAR